MSNDKSPDAFRTISEVADLLDLPQHVLRFWETRFAQIKPLKRGGGRRYYRPEDVDLLRGIRHLLYDEGYTIKGAQRILKDHGARFVMQVWRSDGQPVGAVPVADESLAVSHAPTSGDAETAVAAEAIAIEDKSSHAHGPAPLAPTAGRPPAAVAPSPKTVEEQLPRGILPDPATTSEAGHGRSGMRLMERLLGERSDPGPVGNLSKDDIRRLQATLFELLECKRILDQSR